MEFDITSYRNVARRWSDRRMSKSIECEQLILLARVYGEAVWGFEKLMIVLWTQKYILKVVFAGKADRRAIITRGASTSQHRI